VVVRVDETNSEALRAWDGYEGACWTEHEARFDESLARYHPFLLDAANITTTDQVLDIGCGNGQTTRDAAGRAASGTALGVDLSSAMIELARRRAAEQAITNVAFRQADAQIHAFDADAFDLAISRMGTMWFGNPLAAFTNIARALRPGGRLTMLVWQSLADNEWLCEFRHALAVGRALPALPADAPGPLSLADPGRVRTILSDAGFSDVTLTARREPMYFGKDAGDAYEFVRRLGFAEPMLEGLGEGDRARALDALRATITAHQTDEGVQYSSAVWLVAAQRA
jgi:SAM-dependent methyltransferase